MYLWNTFSCLNSLPNRSERITRLLGLPFGTSSQVHPVESLDSLLRKVLMVVRFWSYSITLWDFYPVMVYERSENWWQWNLFSYLVVSPYKKKIRKIRKDTNEEYNGKLRRKTERKIFKLRGGRYSDSDWKVFGCSHWPYKHILINVLFRVTRMT